MRGEHLTRWAARSMPCGSSPHAWGTPRKVAVEAMKDPVHPHMRGEHACNGRSGGTTCGSSPHAWGTLEAEEQSGSCRRFIPTCVGNTIPAPYTTNIGSVHPHMRGEHN